MCYPFLGFLFLGGRQTALYNQEKYKSNNRYIHTFESKKTSKLATIAARSPKRRGEHIIRSSRCICRSSCPISLCLQLKVSKALWTCVLKDLAVPNRIGQDCHAKRSINQNSLFVIVIFNYDVTACLQSGDRIAKNDGNFDYLLFESWDSCFAELA